MGPATAGNGTDRFLLLLWRVTSHDPGMFMRPDSRRPWRRTAAEKPNQRASSQSSWLPGPSSSNRPFFPIDPSGENGELHRWRRRFWWPCVPRSIARHEKDFPAEGPREVFDRMIVLWRILSAKEYHENHGLDESSLASFFSFFHSFSPFFFFFFFYFIVRKKRWGGGRRRVLTRLTQYSISTSNLRRLYGEGGPIGGRWPRFLPISWQNLSEQGGVFMTRSFQAPGVIKKQRHEPMELQNVLLGVAGPQGASDGNKLSRGHEPPHPGYYCLIGGQTNDFRLPSMTAWLNCC